MVVVQYRPEQVGDDKADGDSPEVGICGDLEVQPCLFCPARAQPVTEKKGDGHEHPEGMDLHRAEDLYGRYGKVGEHALSLSDVKLS